MTPLPESPYCRVRARVASIWADGPDEGTNPDWRPAVGERVTLTPSIGEQLLVYDVAGPAPIIVTVERVQCEVDADGWLVHADGRPVFIAPTDDPILSATGWTWTATIKSKTIAFSAPAGGVVDLALFVSTPAVDAVERLSVVQVVADYIAANPPDVEQAVAEWLTANPPAAAPDATSAVKGLVRLAGDLGGSADAPTVPGLADKADSGHTHTAADIDSGAVTDGHVLTADGAGGAAWEAPPAGGGGGGAIVNPPSTHGIPMGTPVGQSTAPHLAGRGRGTLITVPVDIIVTSITIAVQTASAGAGLARLALYRIADPVAAPYTGSDVRDAGTVDISTVGEKVATFGTPQTLSAGVWMIVITSDTNFTLGCVQVVSAGPVRWAPALVVNNWRNNMGLQNTGAPGVGAVASGMPPTIFLSQASGVSANGAQELVALLDWSRA